MESSAQRESEALRRAFKIRLNDAGSAQQNSDETFLASVAQVGSCFQWQYKAPSLDGHWCKALACHVTAINDIVDEGHF